VFRLRETLLDGSDDSIEAMSKALQLGKGHITSRILLIFLSPNLIRLKTRRNSPRRNRDRKQAGNWKRLAEVFFSCEPVSVFRPPEDPKVTSFYWHLLAAAIEIAPKFSILRTSGSAG
jgi:hypothetical protein